MKTILIMATTLNGMAYNDQNKNMSWTSPGDMEYFTKATKEIGTVIMGRRTFNTLDNLLKARTTIVMSRSQSAYNKEKFDGGYYTDDTPGKILKDLSDSGVKEVAICGGPTINNLFAEEKLIDEIHITINPLIWVFGTEFVETPQTMNLKLISAEVLGEDVVLVKYKVL